jgi:predicted RNA binding protein YcfA (HicA-like mRNA interferase family)
VPKLHSSSHIIDVLKSFGFVFVSQKGSHCKFTKNDKTVIVPHPKSEIPMGTFMSILRQSGLQKSDF